MFDLTAKLLHEVVGGRLRLAARPPLGGEAAAISSIAIDSRQVQPGDVFWGLRGTQVDGANFAEEAFQRGASGVVVGNRYVQPWPGCWSLQVDDAERALTRIAAWNRERFAGTMIAVTGSVGKTTARQMIHSVLSTNRQGSTSPKNFNNRIGLPLSLLGIEPEHDYAALELAASGPGEIAALAGLSKPQIGVITRIGDAHLGGFGSYEQVAHAKAELLSALPPDGLAVLSGDDPWLRKMASRCRANIVWVGRSLDCDVVATRIQYGQGQLQFVVDGHPLQVPVWGRHHVNSALAAVAVGKIFGFSLADIARGLACFQPPPMRCEVTRVGDATIINDTYNASPAAMRAALEVLRDFDSPGRRIVVCGDMRELGPATEVFHRRLGYEVVTLCGADLLVACGDYANEVVAGAQAAGMSAARTRACRQPEESLVHLHEVLGPGDVVLVKGARALAMERLVAALANRDVRAAA